MIYTSVFIIALFVIAKKKTQTKQKQNKTKQPNLETTKMPISRTSEDSVACSHHGTLRHKEKEVTTSTTRNLTDTMFNDRTEGKLSIATDNMDTYC